MSLGDEWAEGTVGSASKLNVVTITAGTGAYLAGLDKSKHKILVCTSTGSGFTINHVYLCNADGTTTTDITIPGPHTHTSSTDGGTLQKVLLSNSKIRFLDLTKNQDLWESNWASAAFWTATTSGTGTIESNIDGSTTEHAIRLRPNGTSGSGSTVAYPSFKLDFTKDSFFQTKLRIETASSLALHTGVRADTITAADSTGQKYNAEICTATNNNWFLRSADGTTASTSDSGTAMTANRVALRIEHYPTLGTPEVDLYIDSGSVFQKTSNIPTTSSTPRDNLLKHSIKNNTAADRPLLVYGTRLIYTVNDEWI